MTEFKVGTKVHVEFDAIVEKPSGWDYIKPSDGGTYDDDSRYGFLKVRDTKDCVYHYVWVCSTNRDSENAVTVIPQTDWEKYGGVQIGDIWEANGNEYFAYLAFGSSLTLFPVNGTWLNHSYSSDRLDDFASLNPRLVRRRGESV